jgi:hypothetical protein
MNTEGRAGISENAVSERNGEHQVLEAGGSDLNSVCLARAVIQLLTMVLISYIVFADVRYTLRRRASKNWPTTAATIDSGFVENRGPFSRIPSILKNVDFTYSYCVGGLKYSGQFFLLVTSKTAGEKLRQELVGRNVLVKYDDRKPGVALLIDQELAGKRVMQGPVWTYR